MLFLFLVLFSTLSLASNVQWLHWKAEHSKTFTQEEDSLRFETFRSNLALIEDLNRQHNPKTFFAMNKFGDMSNKEFSALRNKVTVDTQREARATPITSKIPDQIDWRTLGAVTPVLNQGQCGADEIFAALSAIESAWKIAGHSLVVLSLAQLEDCGFPTSGCDGDDFTADAVYEYVIKAGGLESNETYPTGGSCKFDPSKVVAKLTSYTNVPSGDAAVAQALAMRPVATVIDASHSSFQFYSSGIYSEPSCSSTQLDHAVGLVGYGEVVGGSDYYILKNSWGLDWGMSGYMFIERGGNMCGVASMASYPVAAM